MVMGEGEEEGERREEREREGGRERKGGKKTEEIVEWTTGVSLGEARARVSAGRREGVPVRDSSFFLSFLPSFQADPTGEKKYNK